MEPPKKVKILFKTYDIEYADDYVVDSDGVKRDWMGMHNYETQKIKIKKVHPDEMEDTLVHEVLHGICSAMNINFAEGEEEVVGKISKGLLTVIKQNNWKLGDGLIEPKKESKKVKWYAY